MDARAAVDGKMSDMTEGDVVEKRDDSIAYCNAMLSQLNGRIDRMIGLEISPSKLSSQIGLTRCFRNINASGRLQIRKFN